VSQRGSGSAFPARTGKLATTRSQGANDRRPLWTLQATPAEIAVMDTWVDQYGAHSRSELVAVAVEAYLADVTVTPRQA
jgi:hypothetical protein